MKDPAAALAAYDLTLHFDSLRELIALSEKIHETRRQLAALRSPSPQSPRIRSKAEAKYQRGTRVYTDEPLLTAIEQSEALQAEISALEAQYGTAVLSFSRTATVLSAASFSPYELGLIYDRHALKLSPIRMAEKRHYSYQTIYRHLAEIYAKYSRTDHTLRLMRKNA
jgi:hypothetical protein